MLLFLISGIAYGIGAGTIKNDEDVIQLMNKCISGLASFMVLIFFAAQFTTCFNYSNLGTIISVSGANFLKGIGFVGLPLIICFIILTAFINIFIAVDSAKWAIMAPIFVPMFMRLGLSPELTQVAYRIGDSSTNIIAPLMPFFVLIMETFQVTTGNGYGLNNLTLYNWIGTLDEAQTYTSMEGIFRNAEFGKAVWNTVRLTFIGSIITALCGQFLGYISTRGRGKWYGSATEQLVFVPYLMSGVAFSSMYVAMFSQPRLGGLIPSLYGTFTLIVLTSVVKHFPFASRSGTANMMQIAVELEEAADINGANFWQRMGKIVLPLAKNGFISGFMLTFISIAKELDLIIIMMDKHTQTMSYLAFTYSQEGYNQMADAISVCVLLFILVCYIIANRFGADIGKAW